jgi:hypothetical protein
MSVNRWWHADFITAFYEETLGDALANYVLQKSLVENARISRSTLRGLGGLDCDAGERAGSSGGRRCESRSGGNHRSRPLPAKPPTSTVETTEQLDGDAAMQINCRLGAEDAVAFPTPLPFVFNVGHAVLLVWHRRLPRPGA